MEFNVLDANKVQSKEFVICVLFVAISISVKNVKDKGLIPLSIHFIRLEIRINFVFSVLLKMTLREIKKLNNFIFQMRKKAYR